MQVGMPFAAQHLTDLQHGKQQNFICIGAFPIVPATCGTHLVESGHVWSISDPSYLLQADEAIVALSLLACTHVTRNLWQSDEQSASALSICGVDWVPRKWKTVISMHVTLRSGITPFECISINVSHAVSLYRPQSMRIKLFCFRHSQ